MRQLNIAFIVESCKGEIVDIFNNPIEANKCKFDFDAEHRFKEEDLKELVGVDTVDEFTDIPTRNYIVDSKDLSIQYRN